MSNRLQDVMSTLVAIRGTPYETQVGQEIGPAIEGLVPELGAALVGYELMARGAALVFGCSEDAGRDRILAWLETQDERPKDVAAEPTP